jgi:hypothetical protein
LSRQIDGRLTIVNDTVKLARKHQLRECDEMQLSDALSFIKNSSDLVFICSDNNLNKAACAEGLAVENQNDHVL